MNERHEATFGERVRRVRLRRGWTQEQLADETESFTQVGISNIETGKRPEYVSDLLTLAYALRVHPTDLLNGLPPEGRLKQINVEIARLDVRQAQLNADQLELDEDRASLHAERAELLDTLRQQLSGGAAR